MAERVDRDGYAVFLSSTTAHVNRIRLDPAGVDGAVADLRALGAERGIDSVLWWVGDAATPDDLGEQLAARGLVLRERATSLVLDRPPAGSPAFAARRATTLAEYLDAQEVDWAAIGLPAERRSELRRRSVESWKREGEYGTTFLVSDGGRVIAIGRSRFGADAVFLTGGATLPEERGRGAYTALVHARWDDAVARGTPLLVTQGNEQSGPILRTLGFRPVGGVAIYAQRV